MGSTSTLLKLLGLAALLGLVVGWKLNSSATFLHPADASSTPTGPATRPGPATAPRVERLATPLIQPEDRPPAPAPAVAVSETRPALSTEEIVARSEASVALVRGEKGGGTGFLVRPGVLVTNSHVIQNEVVGRLTVSFPSAPTRQRVAPVNDLLWEEPGRDLAFLSVGSTLPPLDLEASYRFRRGQEVTVIGSPGSAIGDVLENAVSRGVMSTPVSHDDRPYFQMSVAINPGNSGGPVIGSEGRVLGVATLKDRSREGIAFCIPVDEVTRALARMDARRPGAARQVHSRHDALRVCNTLDRIAVQYEDSLVGIADAMDRGLARGVDPGRVLVGVEQSFRTQMGNDLHRYTVQTLFPDVRRAVADSELPRTVDGDLRAFWSLVLDLQKTAELPAGASHELRHLSQSRRQRHRELLSSLKHALDPDGAN
jgi:S1-C subfamily serine protease